jgi:hypothetical protein
MRLRLPGTELAETDATAVLAGDAAGLRAGEAATIQAEDAAKALDAARPEQSGSGTGYSRV